MMVVVVMGVAGCGKTTIGPLLAKALGGDYAEGDQFHPPANIAKMSRGEPLSDDDRMPWLAGMAAAIRDWRTRERPTVLACSALKQRYRDILADGSPEVRFLYLRGTEEVIGARLARRRNHFMPPSLLKSQFATLEEPRDAIVADVTNDPPSIVAAAVAALRASPVLPGQ